MRMLRFLLAQMLGWTFWRLFLACFTIVLMMAWRAQQRDAIFKMAAGRLRIR